MWGIKLRVCGESEVQFLLKPRLLTIAVANHLWWQCVIPKGAQSGQNICRWIHNYRPGRTLCCMMCQLSHRSFAIFSNNRSHRSHRSSWSKKTVINGFQWWTNRNSNWMCKQHCVWLIHSLIGTVMAFHNFRILIYVLCCVVLSLYKMKYGRHMEHHQRKQAPNSRTPCAHDRRQEKRTFFFVQFRTVMYTTVYTYIYKYFISCEIQTRRIKNPKQRQLQFMSMCVQ